MNYFSEMKLPGLCFDPIQINDAGHIFIPCHDHNVVNPLLLKDGIWTLGEAQVSSKNLFLSRYGCFTYIMERFSLSKEHFETGTEWNVTLPRQQYSAYQFLEMKDGNIVVYDGNLILLYDGIHGNLLFQTNHGLLSPDRFMEIQGYLWYVDYDLMTRNPCPFVRFPVRMGLGTPSIEQFPRLIRNKQRIQISPDQSMMFITWHGTIECFSTKTGALKWTYDTIDQGVLDPWIFEASNQYMLTFSSYKSSFLILETITGTCVRTIDLSHMMCNRYQWSLDHSRLFYVDTGDLGMLHCIELFYEQKQAMRSLIYRNHRWGTTTLVKRMYEF